MLLKLLKAEIKDIKENKLPPAQARLNSAKIAFEECKKGNILGEVLT
jgi:hypothetical protein